VGSAIRTATTAEQLLHGEPHPGNVLSTKNGLVFIDLETCCRGPVEFDIAHGLLPSEDGRMLPCRRSLGALSGGQSGRDQSVPHPHLGDDHDLALATR